MPPKAVKRQGLSPPSFAYPATMKPALFSKKAIFEQAQKRQWPVKDQSQKAYGQTTLNAQHDDVYRQTNLLAVANTHPPAVN